MFTNLKHTSLPAFVAGIALTAGAAITFDAMSVGAFVEGESTFVPITPCRMFDTRPAPDNVGPKSTPLGENGTFTQQVTGVNGDCNIPADATAISMNVTATDMTAPSFLTVYPSDAPRPNASNLNYLPGQAAVPNKVDVKLSATGTVDLYNAFGSVNVLADALGYYTDSGLDEIEAQVDLLLSRQSFVAASDQPTSVDVPTGGIGTGSTSVLTVDAGRAPGSGSVIFEATAAITAPLNTTVVNCRINVGDDAGSPALWQPAEDSGRGTITVRRVVDVAQREPISAELECGGFSVPGSVVELAQPLLTATFTTAPPNPL